MSIQHHVTVETEQGRYCGIRGAVNRFLGIPYASPPVGDLRWTKPHPPLPFTGVRNAHEFGSDCPQAKSPHSRSERQDEDCLTLNIWTPHTGAGASLPVLLWLPGGGFVGGSGSDARTDGDTFANKGIVVVTVNYRVGIFGYFAHPQLTEEGSGFCGNYGLHDALAALKWVARNIAGFGGDPTRITLGGVSAGAAQASLLMTTELPPAAIPNQLLLQSPGAMRPLASRNEAQADGAALGEHLDQLRRLSAGELLQLARKHSTERRELTRSRTLRPIVDGDLVRREERDAHVAGQFNAVPTLLGTTLNEGANLAAQFACDDAVQFRSFLTQQFGSFAQDALRMYPAHTAAEVQARLAEVYGDTQFNYGAAALAASLSKRTQVWRYLFESIGNGSSEAPRHGDDVPFAFGVNPVTAGHRTDVGTAAAQEIVLQTNDRWTRFIRDGNPGWPGYEQRSRCIFGISAQPVIHSGWRDEQARLLDLYFSRGLLI